MPSTLCQCLSSPIGMLRVSLFAILAPLVLVACSQQQESSKSESSSGNAVKPSAEAKTGAPAAAGMVAAIDPETGEFIEPTAEELRELEEAAPAPKLVPPELIETELPTGGYAIKVPPSMYSNMVGVTDTQGKLTTECIEAGDHATHNHGENQGGN